MGQIMMRYLATILLLLVLFVSPLFAMNPEEMERDIPTLIERFIQQNTKQGAPHSYTWVIEEITPDSAGQILVEVRILSASLDRKTVDDVRYRIFFAYLDPSPVRPQGFTTIVGYSKLSGTNTSCEPEKK
jgi:hypothetical protein